MSEAKLDLFPAPLTQAAFEPFGDVIDISDVDPIEINEGTTERFHDLARVDTADENGTTLVNIFRGQPRAQPIALRMVERHPLGSQAFYPLRNLPWLVVVAPAGDTVELKSLRAFRATGTQGVNYRKGVWHHPLLVLNADHDFLVIDRGGPGDNCDEFRFEGETAYLEL